MRNIGRSIIGLVALLSCTFAISAAAEVYKWVDADGTVHFSDSAGNAKAQKVEVKPLERQSAPAPAVEDAEEEAEVEPSEQVAPKPKASEDAAPQAEHAPEADLPKPSRKKAERLKKAQSAEKQKANEKICQLRYGLKCDDLYHWKSKLKTDCERNKTDSCEEPQYFIRNKPPSILFRDLGKPFPTVDNTPKQDLECLLDTGFYCYELKNDANCKQNYDVKQCKELREWLNAAQKRCDDEGKDDCAQRALAFRPRTGEELNKIRYGTDLAVEQEEVKDISRMPSNRDKYIQRLWDIVNQYPGD